MVAVLNPQRTSTPQADLHPANDLQRLQQLQRKDLQERGISAAQRRLRSITLGALQRNPILN